MRLLETPGVAFTALVTDIRMEPMDGVSLANIVRLEWPRIPILFVSGFDPRDGKLPGELLRKPFDLSHFLAAVERLFPQSRRADESA